MATDAAAAYVGDWVAVATVAVLVAHTSTGEHQAVAHAGGAERAIAYFIEGTVHGEAG